MLINNTLHIYKHLNFKAMKKFFSMMVAVAAMFTFAACGDSETPEPQKPAGKTQLEKPVVTVSNQTEDGFTLTWEPVANATEYLVYVNKDLQPKTTETTYTFSDLNAGTYKPRVKAIGGGNYKDSDYSDAVEPIVLTGATSVDWFTQTVALPEDSDELAAKGINSSNTFVFNWKGEGVESISYTYFHIDELKDLTEDDIIADMKVLDAENLASVNTAEGVSFQFSGLAGDATYVLYALATKGGKEFLAKNEIKTNPTILTTSTQYWMGVWNVRTQKTIEFADTAIKVEDKVDDFTYSIEQYYENYSDIVYLDGQSVINKVYGPDNGLMAYTDYTKEGDYVLTIMNPAFYSEVGEGQYLAYLAFGDVVGAGEAGVYFVSGQYPAITFISDGTNITCEMYQGNLSEGGTFTVAGMDIAFCDDKGQILGLGTFTLEDGSKYDHNVFRYGPIQILGKAEATPAALSVKANKFSVADVTPVSYVVAM
jgi:predicted small lipoprotein YifL